MIPLKLTVKNFICYLDNAPTLDLEGIHVACLCGNNGHGKTALLDAITWALWGKARARTHDELIHQGRSDMAVDLEFLARGQRHRVSRRYARSGRSSQGRTLLEHQVSSGNGFTPVTGNTVGETQADITELLHMDYDTFVNTAFLLQGRADLFTTSTPLRRKELLAEVLDLSYYQRLEARAKDLGREAQDRIRDADAAIALRRREILRRPELEEKLESVEATLVRVGPETHTAQARVDELRIVIDQLRGHQRELDALSERVAVISREGVSLKGQMGHQEARVSGYRDTLAKQSEILVGFGRLESVRAELDRHDQALARKSALDADKAPLERQIAVQEERLSGQIVRVDSIVSEQLQPRADRVPHIETALRETAPEQKAVDGMDDEIARKRDEAQSFFARVRFLEEANASLKEEMAETRKKFDMLDEGDAQCPLCNQPLGPDGKEHLRREYEAVGREARQRYDAQDAERKESAQKHSALSAEVTRDEADRDRRRRELQTKVVAWETELAEARRAREELQPARQELDGLREMLGAKSFALEERQALVELSRKLEALSYDDVAHRHAREGVAELEPFGALNSRLHEAREQLPTAVEALETTKQIFTRQQQEAQEAERRKAELAEQQKSLPSLETELADAESRSQELARRLRQSEIDRGVLRENLARCEALEEEVSRHEKDRARLAEEKGVYDELAVAFGKNGIQALMIETAIPHLENDANELLGRLTEGQMTLKLQLKEGRMQRGMPSEELDIRIADEVGTRSYETFSGGEAFRIDFALRIALSKLLARRSGAPLPILFIDEGFGSQDSAGQERLREAIQAIQSDFQKIIAITHVEQVKDSFPVRIEVTKTAAGSTFQVV